MYGTDSQFNAIYSHLGALNYKGGKVTLNYPFALTESQAKKIYELGWYCGGTGEFWKI